MAFYFINFTFDFNMGDKRSGNQLNIFWSYIVSTKRALFR